MSNILQHHFADLYGKQNILIIEPFLFKIFNQF